MRAMYFVYASTISCWIPGRSAVVARRADNSSTVVDLKTLKAVNKVMTGGNPDAILYEPVHHEVYTFNGSGKSATVFAAKSGTVIATIPLMGKPEAAVFDGAVNRVYVNIEDKGEIAVIDVVTHAVVATWPLNVLPSVGAMLVPVADNAASDTVAVLVEEAVLPPSSEMNTLTV